MPSVTGMSATAQAKVHVAVGGCPCWDMLSTALWARRWAEAEGQTLHFPRKTTALHRLARASRRHLTAPLSLGACATGRRCHSTSPSQ